MTEAAWRHFQAAEVEMLGVGKGWPEQEEDTFLSLLLKILLLTFIT